MTREQVVRLTILTACIFGFSIYMQKGTWVFPFPMYELSLLGALIALYIVDKKKPGITGGLAFIWAILHLTTSQFVLEFFFDDHDFQRFYESAVPDFLLLGFSAVFLVWGILISLKSQKLALQVFGIIGCVAFITCFVLNAYLWAMIPLVGWLMLLVIAEKEGTIHRNILFLFTFFFLSKHLTLFWMGG